MGPRKTDLTSLSADRSTVPAKANTPAIRALRACRCVSTEQRAKRWGRWARADQLSTITMSQVAVPSLGSRGMLPNG